MALTWRNVDGPDFGRSLEGIRTFGNLFGDAVGGLDRGLAMFDAAQDKRANNQFAMDLLKFQDPAAYKTALASGTVFAGVDPRRLSQASIQAAGSRVGDLLNQRLAGIQGDAAQFNLTNAQDDRAADMNNAAGAARYLTTGEGSLADMKGFGTRRLVDLAKDRQGYIAGDVGIDTARLGMDQTRQNMKFSEGRYNNEQTQFGWQVEDRNTQLAAEKYLMGVDMNSFDQTSGEAWLRSQNISDPRVYNAVRARIPSLGLGQGSSASGMISGAASDPSRVMNYEARASGFGSVPDSVKTLGDASDFALQVNQANKARTGSAGSSAMGLYQIVGETMRTVAPKVLGANWREQGFTPENQDKIAAEIFRQNSGSAEALRKQWVSLSPAEAEQVRKLPWAQARQVIAGKESGATPQQLAMGGASVAVGLATRSGERNANSMAPDYMAAMQDTRPVGAIVADMKKNSIYKGKSETELLEMVQQVQAEAAAGPQGRPITAKYAADILERNPQANNPGGVRRFLNNIASIGGYVDPFGWYNNTPAPVVNRKGVSEAIRSYADGRTQQEVMGNVDQGIATQEMGQVAAQLQAAQSRLASAQLAVRAGRNVNLAPLIAEVQQLSGMLNNGQRALEDDQSRTSYPRAAPPPRPIARNRPSVAPAPPPNRRQMWEQALAR